MPKNEAKVKVEKLEARVKLVDEKEDGVVIARHLVTEVKLEYAGTPGNLEDILYTLQAGHSVDVTFTSPQQILAKKEDIVE